MIRNKILLFSTALFLALAGYRECRGEQLRNGDIIFHTSRSAQSLAVQKATRSKYSHMGVIFFRDGSPYVYEAVKTVRYTPLKKWIARGEGGHYIVKRLRNADRVLTPESVAMLVNAAGKYEGKPYDLTFEWSDDRMYCSELVWKIYYNGLGMKIGRLQKLHEFDLGDRTVKVKMQERYGDKVPYDEKVISPAEMFSSEALVEAATR